MATHDLPVLIDGAFDPDAVTADSLADGTTKKMLTATERIKLAGVATGATATVDATTSVKGIVQLAGDLAGTATAPVIAAGAVTSAKILDGAIVDGDINASAAIAQSKVFGLVSDLAGKSALTGYGAERVFNCAFPSGANGKIDLYFTGEQYSSFEITLVGVFGGADATGTVQALVSFAGSNTGTVYSSAMSYEAVQGGIRDHFGLTGVTWDAVNSRWRITLVHRTSTANAVSMRVRWQSQNSTYSNSIRDTIGVSAVYTTSSATVPKPTTIGQAYAICATDAPFNADPTGVLNSTAALQAAVAAVEASTASSKTLLIPRGTYKTDGTITIGATTGVHISAYGAKILANVPNGTAALELKTTPPNYTGGNRTMIYGLHLESSVVGAGVGIHVNFAQQWHLQDVLIMFFDTGLKVGDSYYGSVGGNTSMYGCTVSLDLVSDDVNIVDFRNLKISGSEHLVGATSYGVRSTARMATVKFSGVTIEGVDYGFSYTRQTQGTCIFKCEELYFEQVAICCLDFSQKDDTAFVQAEMSGIYFNETITGPAIKLASGAYSFLSSAFKNNRILIDNDSSGSRISLNTDLPISQIDFTYTQSANVADGLVQLNSGTARFVEGNVYLYNPKLDYSSYPTAQSHLPSIVDARPLVALSPLDIAQTGKFYPVHTVQHRDVAFEKGGVVLKSPAGRYFRLTVDDAGTVTTQDITAAKKMLAPGLSTIQAQEIGRREVRGTTYVIPEGTTLTVLETQRKVTKTSGVLNDVLLPYRAFGTTLDAVATTPGSSFGVPFFWDTDIEFFYCWQGSYWAWAGSNASEATAIRAIGTLAQRPATPALASMRYYATDNTTRYTWNGTAWS